MIRRLGIGVFACIAALSILAGLLPHHPYEEQFREAIDQPPSKHFWLGTDALGRDRWSRLVYGTRVSLALAPAAAAFSVALAILAGGLAGYWGRNAHTAITSAADVFMAVPWFFLLTAVRAALPLNTGPFVSLLITFVLLGVLGWASPARLISIRTREIAAAGYIRQARATGASRGRILLRHIAPNLAPIAAAQFWTLVPAYIVAEANLGVLGLGVAEPLPSWGALLREMESASGWGGFHIVLPLLLLALVAATAQLSFSHGDSR